MPGAAAQEPTAVLVVAAWPHGTPPHVAARITSTLDVRQPERESVAATGRDEIAAAIDRWLDGLARLEHGDGPVTGP